MNRPYESPFCMRFLSLNSITIRKALQVFVVKNGRKLKSLLPLSVLNKLNLIWLHTMFCLHSHQLPVELQVR